MTGWKGQRGYARAVEQVFRTCELMPCGPVAESESRVERIFAPFQVQKTQSPGAFGYEREGWVPRVRRWRHKIWKQTQLRHSAFLWMESAVEPFEEREGMEGEHTPETDFIKHYQILEESDKFENSFLRLDRCCFLALLRVWQTFWNALRCLWSNLPSRKIRQVVSERLPHHMIQ